MRGLVIKSGVLSIALATGVAVVGLSAASAPAYAQGKGKKGEKAAAGASGYSNEFIALAAPIQQKITAADAVKNDKAALQAALAGLPQQIAQAEAAAKTPKDRLAAGQFNFNLGILTNNIPLVKRGGQAMLASGQLDAAQAATIQGVLAQIGGDPVTQAVDAQVKANNPRGALAELRRAVTSQPAGQRAPATWYDRALQIADANQLGSEAIYWSALRVEHHPGNLSWLSAAQVLNKYGSQEPQDKLDVFRLMARSGGLNNDARLVGREYFNYADLANLRGFYNEAVTVIDQGLAAGALTSAQTAQIRRAASSRVAADRASLAGQESRGRAAADGIPALAAADLYLSFGQPAKAEELYKVALQKGGARFDRNRALTRLGMVQFDQGKYAEARDSFSKVTGPRAQVARMWLALINQRGGTRPA